ncbi:CPBP family intramembrane glutamic endopeptidase [Neolewinella antarctica]|uniref:CAAX prenyl protease 2/Lysostaphin resistance protein A-like domain-containing protein n=1 Tax=Neolewinella antarctica TaxID=442734 RepID=A0ABX0XC43_9BACT|nr:type II CAAX endopeptidase family protein [Neolewinella antarctica]NJC26846.1 hypothetical protein [Neolewinella antarctica]
MIPLTHSPRSATRVFLATLAALLVMFIVGQLILFGLVQSGGLDLSDLGSLDLDQGLRQRLRLGLFLNNTLMFAGSAAAGLWFVYRNNWLASVYLDRGPRDYSLSYAIGFFVITLPIVAYSAYLNLQISLPEWAVNSEESTDALLAQILRMESVPEFVLAFLTIAVSAGLGEELLLRGVLQNRILGGWLGGNHHVRIWVAAALFSAMHIEFAGFLPRLLLGASLGYAYYWTRSLWVPILLHLAFNGIQVVIAYVTGEFDPTGVEADVPAWWLVLICVPLAGYIAYAAERKFAGAGEVMGADAGAKV